MTFILADRTQETTSTIGTGTLSLTGAVAQYQTFATAIGVGNTTYYTLVDGNGSNWELGSGTVGTGTLSRTTILFSTNSNTQISLSASIPHYVFCNAPAILFQPLFNVANNTILSNISGSIGSPSNNNLTAIFDSAFGTSQGNIIFRSSTAWTNLPAGTTGQVLQTQGNSSDTRWTLPVLSFNTRTGNITLTSNDVVNALGYIPGNAGSSVLSFNTRTGNITLTSSDVVNALGWGNITLTGAITGASNNGNVVTSYGTISNNTILANITGSTASPSANNVSAILDSSFGTATGNIIYRNSTAWSGLGAGTTGQVLTQGSTLPSWSTIGYSNLPSEIRNSLGVISIPGLMPTNSRTLLLPIVQNTQLPANFGGSNGYALTSSTGSFVFTVSYIHSGSPANIGTVTFNTGVNVPIFSTQAAVNLVNGDFLYVTTQLVGDGSLADVGITVVLLKQ